MDDKLEPFGASIWSIWQWEDEPVVKYILEQVVEWLLLTVSSRGLAQKLAIRLGKQFPQSKLIEINAHSLGSKFFSESGKLVSRMFESIDTMLGEEPDTLACVFVDEVETLASRREKSLSSNDPFDAVRAVNSLLTGLDRLRLRPNVVVLCTSNLITALVMSDSKVSPRSTPY